MAEERARPIVMGPGDGQTVANPAGGGLTYKARSGQTGGGLTAWESTAAPGEGPPLHVHANEDEFIREGDRIYRTYFIDGRGSEILGTVWSHLDTTALGRQEEWENSPEGWPQTDRAGGWWDYNDAYAN
jgi:predicted dithiol-disulfide oxidoreductase (DUF899 family)